MKESAKGRFFENYISINYVGKFLVIIIRFLEGGEGVGEEKRSKESFQKSLLVKRTETQSNIEQIGLGWADYLLKLCW